MKLTSHGGGALLYEGTILNVTDPRASRCEKRIKNVNFHKKGLLESIIG